MEVTYHSIFVYIMDSYSRFRHVEERDVEEKMLRPGGVILLDGLWVDPGGLKVDVLKSYFAVNIYIARCCVYLLFEVLNITTDRHLIRYDLYVYVSEGAKDSSDHCDPNPNPKNLPH